VAQLQLALRQPPAYRHFAVGAPEWAALNATVAVPKRWTWLLQPARRVFRLVAEGSIELLGRITVFSSDPIIRIPHPG
jgi:hypothetical protein